MYLKGYQEGHTMKLFRYAGIIAIILILFILPAQAFTADSMDITMRDNGDANIQFDYTLNWIEHIAVYIRIANPADELNKAFRITCRYQSG
jgi:hypothetical protein